MSDQERLAGYVAVWRQAVTDLTDLLASLPDEDWARPTDLPGWDVRAGAAHVAHLEAVLAGGPEETAEVPDAPHLRGELGRYTEIGVLNRRDRSPQEIVAEIRDAASRRHASLLAAPPTDASARPERVFAGVPWSWEVLLRNRPLDVWMHEQDVRRAVGRPGGLDSPAARHTVAYLSESLGYVLAKRVGAAPGTTAVLEVAGHPPVAYAVSDAGRGERLDEVPADPTVLLRMDPDSFVRLAGGRCEPEPGAVGVTGDQDLGARLLGALATTP